MRCERPWSRVKMVTKKQLIMSQDARDAVSMFPCGQCYNCRINKASLWTNRLVLESMSNPESAFITLTYNDLSLPFDQSVDPKELQDFIKRLRYYLGYKIRYYGVGEYGMEKLRAHYHLAVFGLQDLFHAEEMVKKAWGDRGFVMVGELNRASARYTVGYVVKGCTHMDDIRLNGRHPEFARMSRHPGLGAMAAEKIRDASKDGVLVKEVRLGKRTFPLGRYLSSKVNVSRETLKEADYKEFQCQTIDKHFKEGSIYYDDYQKDWSVKRLQQVKRHKLWNRRNKI